MKILSSKAWLAWLAIIALLFPAWFLVGKSLCADGLPSPRLMKSFRGESDSETAREIFRAMQLADNRAKYYVAPSGNDNGRGTADDPFRTINHALKQVPENSEIHVRPGVYCENIVLSGKHDITISGERGPAREWLTVLSGVTNIGKNAWIPAPEIGKEVYKSAALPTKKPKVIVYGDKYIPRISEEHLHKGATGKGKGGTVTKKSGFELLSQDRNDTIYNEERTKVKFWDCYGAAFAYDNGTNYIRFRDGIGPNSLELLAPHSVSEKGIVIKSPGNVVKDIRIIGFEGGILINGTAACHNIVISNSISHGNHKIEINGSGAGNIIYGNTLRGDCFTEVRPGAHAGSDREGPYGKKATAYLMAKTVFSRGAQSEDVGIRLISPGANTVVERNLIEYNIIGIGCIMVPFGTPVSATNIHIRANVVHGHSSAGIIVAMTGGLIDLKINDNLVCDNNLNLRFQYFGLKSQSNNLFYVYRNRCYNPPGIGSQIHLNWQANEVQSENPADYPEMYFYHNSFAGGVSFIGGANVPPVIKTIQILPRTAFLNNIFSADTNTPLVFAGTASIAYPKLYGAFDYNWSGGRHHHGEAACFGPHNVNAQGRKVWNGDSLPDFILPADSDARGCGVDLSRSQTVQGWKLGPLPGMEKGYFKGKSPDAGALQFGEKPDLLDMLKKEE